MKHNIGWNTPVRSVSTAALLGLVVLGTTTACAGHSAPASVSSQTSPTAGHSGSAADPGSSSGGQSAVSPDTYVAGAWLSAAQMPFAQAGVTTWDAEVGVGTRLSGSVYEQTPTQFASSLGTCTPTQSGSGIANALGSGLAGSQYEIFQSSNSDHIRPDGTIPAGSFEQNLFYASATAAHAALAALPEGYENCKAEITGTDPTTGTKVVGEIQQTLAGNSAQCWSILAASLGAIDHTCYVQSGRVIAGIAVTVHQVTSLHAVNFRSIDSTELSELRHALRAYAG